MQQNEFERLLDVVCQRLTADVRETDEFHRPAAFENRVRDVVSDVMKAQGFGRVPDAKVQSFPDIVVGSFGIEAKVTESDSWRCIANSVSEGNRVDHVSNIYVVYGKLGGTPEVKWADYGSSIMHVRTSHVPRFEIEIGTKRPLFESLDTTYEVFCSLPMAEKMPLIRKYARSRLVEGERLWWLEDREVDDQQHSLGLSVKIYMDLPQGEKRALRAEAALLCPQVMKGSRSKRKYSDAVLYLMTYRGVLCPQARDLFSAGSVAGKERGGNYLMRAMIDIEQEIADAADRLEDRLFEEYWGHIPARQDRVREWLARADSFAVGWKPSDEMFKRGQVGLES